MASIEQSKYHCDFMLIVIIGHILISYVYDINILYVNILLTLKSQISKAYYSIIYIA